MLSLLVTLRLTQTISSWPLIGYEACSATRLILTIVATVVQEEGSFGQSDVALVFL